MARKKLTLAFSAPQFNEKEYDSGKMRRLVEDLERLHAVLARELVHVHDASEIEHTSVANESYDLNTDGNGFAIKNGCWYSDDGSAYTLTLEDSDSLEMAVGSSITAWNEGAGTLTINEGTGTTLFLLNGSSSTDTAGGMTMATGGYVKIFRKSATVYIAIMGAGLTP